MLEDEDEYMSDDLDIDLDGEDYLNDDEILVSEEDEVDEDFIYEKLKRRNSPHANRIIGNSLTDEIVANESGGNYQAQNPHSSAVGKYQFLWGKAPGDGWGDKIKQVTGVKSKEEFKNSPEAQEKFYNDYYVPHEMMPAVKRLKRFAPDVSDKQLAKLYHYQGEGGAGKYLRGEVPDIQQSYNAPISKYTGINRQVGGGVQPLTTNFRTPTIDPNYPLKNINQNKTKLGQFIADTDWESVGDTVSDGYNAIKKIGSGVAQGLSTAIDMGEQFTSEANKNQQYRKMMQKLADDKTSNYAPASQRINNNPVLI